MRPSEPHAVTWQYLGYSNSNTAVAAAAAGRANESKRRPPCARLLRNTRETHTFNKRSASFMLTALKMAPVRERLVGVPDAVSSARLPTSANSITSHLNSTSLYVFRKRLDATSTTCLWVRGFLALLDLLAVQ